MRCRRILVVLLLFVAAAAAAPSATAQVFVFHLDATQEVPPTTSPARGGCHAEFAAATSQLTLRCVHDLAGATVGHIHRGAAGTNGAIVFDLGNPASPIVVTWNGMTPADVADLLAGNLYVNLHTAGLPAGAIRGQILPRTVDTVPFTADGSQVVPAADPTPATASCTADLDAPATSLSVQCTHDVPAPDTAHVHDAPRGQVGPATFTFPSAASPLAANVPLTPLQVASFAAGFLYLDIHSASASIRGQIGTAPPPPSADVAVSKTTAATSVVAGANLSYSISVTNAGPDTATDLLLTDVLPPSLRFVSLTAPAGWVATTPAVGSSGTITATSGTLASGATASFTLVVQVAPTATGTIVNTATIDTTSSDPQAANDSSTTAPVPVTAPPSPASVSGTKTFSGTRVPGSTVIYTIVLTNTGAGAQLDNPGAELTDVLPATLTLVSAIATSGTAVATPATNAVTWNGSIAAGASVTITITATIDAATPPGTSVTNQATIATDLDGNGTNETTRVTDDPTTGAAGDATAFFVLSATPLAVPANPAWALLLLALAMVLAPGIRQVHADRPKR